MSPFSKVEMSPFVILKWKLQHERYGAGGAPTTHEPERAKQSGSNSTSQAQDAQTTSGSRAVVTISAASKTALQSLSERRSCGSDIQTARPAFQQSVIGKDNQQSTAIIARSLL